MDSHNIQAHTIAHLKSSDGLTKAVYHSTPAITEDGEICMRVINDTNDVIDQQEVPMRSFVNNFIDSRFTKHLINEAMFMYSTAGVPGNVYNHSDWRADATGAETDFGIQIGTDDGSGSALAGDNYSLGTQLTTNWTHSDMSHGVPYVSGVYSVVDMYRSFTNNTGGAVTIEETGLVTEVSSSNYLWARDLLGGSAVTVNDSETLDVTYRLKTGPNFYIYYLNCISASLAASTTGRSYTNLINDTPGSVPSIGTDESYQFYLDIRDTPTEITGLVVGTNGDPIDVNDYKLGAAIETGTGAGQLTYLYQNYRWPMTAGSTRRYMLQRPFKNESGGSITVKETALYAQTIQIGDQRRGMMYRELLNGATGIVVDDGDILEVEIIFQTTCP